MGKCPDISEFERGMIVGARRGGCSISETVSLLGLSKTTVSRVYREWSDRQKTRSHRGSCGRKRLVDARGERRMERLVEANSQATLVQIRTLYNSGGDRERPISLTTTRRTLKRLGYTCKTPRCDQLESNANPQNRSQTDPDPPGPRSQTDPDPPGPRSQTDPDPHPDPPGPRSQTDPDPPGPRSQTDPDPHPDPPGPRSQTDPDPPGPRSQTDPDPRSQERNKDAKDS